VYAAADGEGKGSAGGLDAHAAEVVAEESRSLTSLSEFITRPIGENFLGHSFPNR